MQIHSLTRILANNIEDHDMVTHCLERDLPVDKFKKEVRYSYMVYKRLLDQPEGFFQLDDINTDICRHLLLGPLFKKKGRKHLTRKLQIIHDHPFHLN